MINNLDEILNKQIVFILKQRLSYSLSFTSFGIFYVHI